MKVAPARPSLRVLYTITRPSSFSASPTFGWPGGLQGVVSGLIHWPTANVAGLGLRQPFRDNVVILNE